MNTSRHIVRIYRVSRIAAHLLYGVVVVILLFPWLADGNRARLVRRWSRSILAILNIRMRISGEMPDLASRNVMLVSNHVSWLDIYVLNAIRPVRFVSKMEVLSWPVIGWLAKKTGTLFIDRTRRHDTKRVNHEVSHVLSNGGVIAIFPEGTTSDGSKLLPFHASLLQPAVQSHSHVWPVALRYTNAEGLLNPAVAYVDEITFGQSLAMVLGQQTIYVEVQFLPPLSARSKERRELAREAEQAIAGVLGSAIAAVGA